MEREDYVKLYDKSPEEIMKYVTDDMLNILAYAEIDDNISDKISEWRYILTKIEGKI